jgi:hypothetical protein
LIWNDLDEIGGPEDLGLEDLGLENLGPASRVGAHDRKGAHD